MLAQNCAEGWPFCPGGGMLAAMIGTLIFAPPGDKAEVETGMALTPRFDADGLVPAIAVDALDGEVLMLAWMNAEALARTVESGFAWYWSRSRQRLWKKGESSGHLQEVVEMRLDCDQDTVLLRVRQHGPGACHVGHRSCFYRRVRFVPEVGAALEPVEAEDA